jgi:hypothetical protein
MEQVALPKDRNEESLRVEKFIACDNFIYIVADVVTHVVVLCLLGFMVRDVTV